MTRLLAITASPQTQSSVSSELVKTFTDTWSEANPNGEIAHRDIGLSPPPHLDEATIGAFYTPDGERTPDQELDIALSDELVSELESADVIVIGAPMHNFGISSGLKTWLDHVTRVGRTFRYTSDGPEGLLKDKDVYVLTARGGNYSEDGPIAHLDHQTPYLRTVLGFIGLEDVNFIHGQGVAKGGEGIERAKQSIAAALATLHDRTAA